MARPANWWYTLQAGRREALLAVDLDNRVASVRSLEGFVVHMHLAWLYLLHAKFDRDGLDYRYRKTNGHFVRVDGEVKTWELARCVVEAFPDDSSTLPEPVQEDWRYDFRVLLLPQTGPKTEADAVMRFIREDEMNEEQRQARDVVQTIVKNRQVAVQNKGRHKPGTVARIVSEQLEVRFSTGSHHTTAWRYYKGPTAQWRPPPRTHRGPVLRLGRAPRRLPLHRCVGEEARARALQIQQCSNG